MTYPLPPGLVQKFAGKVKNLFVVEELDPFLEENIKILGIHVEGKKHLPRFGELEQGSRPPCCSAGRAGGAANRPEEVSTSQEPARQAAAALPGLPAFGRVFCIEHNRAAGENMDAERKNLKKNLRLIITGDIGCYTLATYPPLRAMDTTACMGASIGQAIGLEKAGVSSRIVAVIGDSTFMHSGITGIVDAVYNDAKITVIILDNGTTAMTGHQDHPGSGISAQGKVTKKVEIEKLVRGAGVKDVQVVNSFNIKEVRGAIRSALDSPSLAVVIVRGKCAVVNRVRKNPRQIDLDKCNDCGVCVMIGCQAIQKRNDKLYIDSTICMGGECTICEQLCPKHAIGPFIQKPAGD